MNIEKIRKTVYWNKCVKGGKSVKVLLKDISDSHLLHLIPYLQNKPYDEDNFEKENSFLQHCIHEQSYRYENEIFVEDYEEGYNKSPISYPVTPHSIARSTMFWTDKGGNKRKISELSDSHLLHLIPFLEEKRYGTTNEKYLHLMKNEMDFRFQFKISVPMYKKEIKNNFIKEEGENIITGKYFSIPLSKLMFEWMEVLPKKAKRHILNVIYKSVGDVSIELSNADINGFYQLCDNDHQKNLIMGQFPLTKFKQGDLVWWKFDLKSDVWCCGYYHSYQNSGSHLVYCNQKQNGAVIKADICVPFNERPF